MVGFALLNNGAFADTSSHKLFEIAEAAAPTTDAATTTKKSCGAGSCAGKAKKSTHHCGHKHKKATCATKAKSATPEPTGTK